MAGIASKSQLRMSFLRYALFTVPALLLLGTLSATLSGAGEGNAWFTRLHKPPLMPPGWVFSLVWSILYILLGLSLAMLLHARGAKGRQKAVNLFLLQLLLSFAWPFVFFAYHRVDFALGTIAAMGVIGVARVFMNWRIRPLAGLLLYPYLAWLIFAGLLDYQILARNPNAATLAPGQASTDIPL